MDDALHERGKSLEEAFFAKQSRDLIEKLKTQDQTAEAVDALRKATGIADESVLEGMVELGLGPETVASLSLVPLVDVAWADGEILEAERQAILEAAHSAGLDNAATNELLSGWLKRRPELEVIDLWKDYVAELKQSLTPDVFAALKKDIMGRAFEVADSAGGLLGIGTISKAERRRLSELEEAFR